jgi:hypothetical protein
LPLSESDPEAGVAFLMKVDSNQYAIVDDELPPLSIQEVRRSNCGCEVGLDSKRLTAAPAENIIFGLWQAA